MAKIKQFTCDIRQQRGGPFDPRWSWMWYEWWYGNLGTGREKTTMSVSGRDIFVGFGTLLQRNFICRLALLKEITLKTKLRTGAEEKVSEGNQEAMSAFEKIPSPF